MPIYPVPLRPFDVAAVEDDPATICGLDASLRITHVNRAWRQFARDNGGEWDVAPWTLGVEVMSAVPLILRPFYEGLFERARTSDAPVEHSYECSSATVMRHFRMRIFPCVGGVLLVAHSLLNAAPHEGIASPAIAALYRDARGFVHQCAHCRRVRRGASDTRPWDWVPDYVARPVPNTSHGLCPLCEQFYFPS